MDQKKRTVPQLSQETGFQKECWRRREPPVVAISILALLIHRLSNPVALSERYGQNFLNLALNSFIYLSKGAPLIGLSLENWSGRRVSNSRPTAWETVRNDIFLPFHSFPKLLKAACGAGWRQSSISDTPAKFRVFSAEGGIMGVSK